MAPHIAVIGGTSLFNSSLFSGLIETTVPTKHGTAVVHITDKTSPNPLVFVQRHHADGDLGASVYRPPHLINHRATFAALRSLEVTHIIAVCSVGSVDASLPPGSMLVPDDFFSLFCNPVCFHDDAAAHIVPGFDAPMRQSMLAALREAPGPNPAREENCTYIQTTGPRFETPAEVRFLSKAGVGHVVGMTSASEATMAKELGIPYACVCMVDNMANGMLKDPLTPEQFKANVAGNQPTVEAAIGVVLAAIRKSF